VLIVSALLCLLFLLVPRPKEDRTQVAELPPQLAKIVLERETAPAPPPPPAKIEKKAEEQPANAHPKKPDDPKPETVKNPVPEARNPQPNKPPGEIEGARRKAAGVGLLAMKDQLAEIRGAPVAVQLNQNIKAGPGVGSGTGPGVGAGDEQGIPVRALITSNATNGSGGINTAAFSRNTGGGGLAGHIIGQRVLTREFDDIDGVPRFAQVGHHAAVVGVAAGDRIERPRHQQREAHYAPTPASSGPSKDAQAVGASRMTILMPARFLPCSPSRPSRQAADSSLWTWKAMNSVVVLVPLNSGFSSRLE
jgi:hypothetical protein